MMAQCLSETQAREIMGAHVLGTEEAGRAWRGNPWFNKKLGASPPIPYSAELLAERRETHLLVLGLPRMTDGRPFTILNLRKRFGVRSDHGPCFSRIGLPSDGECAWTRRAVREGWFLISREILPESRRNSFAACRGILAERDLEMPFAVDAVYAAIFWELLLPPSREAAQERMLRHTCTWCADEVEGHFLRVGYNQRHDGFHFLAYPPDAAHYDHGALAIVPPDASSVTKVLHSP